MGNLLNSSDSKRTTHIVGGRWIYILFVLILMHVLLDARTLIVQLFAARAMGFVALAIAYFLLALALMTDLAIPVKLLDRLNYKFRTACSSLFRNRPKKMTIFVSITAVAGTLLGIGLRWFFISKAAIDPNIADMLPLIQGACDNLINGFNPYLGVYEMPWKLPLIFWPGLWLPYSVFRCVGIDIRWLHICVVTGIATVLITIITKSLLKRNRIATAISAFSALFLFLFSSEWILFAGYGHTPPVWAWISLLAVAVLTKRSYLTAVSLGILLASRQTAIIFAPLVFIYWYRTYSSYSYAIKLSLIAFITFCIVCGPFLFLTPSNFLFTPIQHYTQHGEWDFTRGVDSFSATTIGFAYYLRKAQMSWLLQATMITTLLASILLAWKRIHSDTDLFLCMGFIAIAMTLTSPISWTYEYFPALLLISFAAIAAGRNDDILNS
jgi:hypothetical protein